MSKLLMKKIHWLRAQIYYVLGDLSSKLLNLIDTDLSTSILYPIYNHCMIKSMLISDKHNLEIWTP